MNTLTKSAERNNKIAAGVKVLCMTKQKKKSNREYVLGLENKFELNHLLQSILQIKMEDYKKKRNVKTLEKSNSLVIRVHC